MVIQVQFQNSVLFLIEITKQSRVGNEKETIKLKIHTAEAEAEITGPENLPPGIVKELAQETEGRVTIFGTDYINLAWCVTIEHS